MNASIPQNDGNPPIPSILTNSPTQAQRHVKVLSGDPKVLITMLDDFLGRTHEWFLDRLPEFPCDNFALTSSDRRFREFWLLLNRLVLALKAAPITPTSQVLQDAIGSAHHVSELQSAIAHDDAILRRQRKAKKAHSNTPSGVPSLMSPTTLNGVPSLAPLLDGGRRRRGSLVGTKSSPAVKRVTCLLSRTREAEQTVCELAKEIAARIPQKVYPYNFSLTSWDGRRATIEQAAKEFHAMVGRNAPKGSGVILCLDRNLTGRWHVHGILVTTTEIKYRKIKEWWRRLPVWQGIRQPMKRCQVAYSLAHSQIRIRLVHHLSAERDEDKMRYRSLELPPLSQSVTVSGSLAWPWHAAALKQGIVGVPMPASLTPSTREVQLPRTSAKDRVCLYCSEKLDHNTKQRSSCSKKCCDRRSRRMVDERKEHGSEIDAWIDFLQLEQHFRFEHAIRMARTAVYAEDEAGCRDWRKYERFARCGCDQPLLLRGDATTCGDPLCRKRRTRKRARRRQPPVGTNALDHGTSSSAPTS